MSEEKEKEIAENQAEDAFFRPDPDQADPMGIGEREKRRQQNRRTRSWIYLGLVLVLGLVLIYFLREDLCYFFQSTTPEDLGLAEELPVSTLEHNAYVRIEGIARDMCIRAEVLASTVRFMYLLGSEMGGRILIEAPVKEEEACLGAVDRVYQGRLIHLGTTSRYERVLAYYRSHFPAAPDTGPVYLLQDGHQPRDSWWYPLAVVVVLVLWGFNVRTLWRFRRRSASVADEGGTP